ncbi:uncharacterized protein LOC106153851 [Lingula anatina]|uniref:Uncharacterized protein LOC106153851 n=1 Tax=Lingula anatina TaxID=7574 RepID=A0A1S3HBM4_LINAN|nr:uncharacterized protein LOC106153851 [Lingula anatina]|eukprot:XP_013383415.1 uncharacterized protein LOC106153851 [Lingula anatina]
MLKMFVKEGWKDQSRDILQATFRLAGKGQLVAKYDGVVVGFVTLYNFSETNSFLNYLIVKPEHRHKGFGSAMLRKAHQLAEARTISFIATLPAVPLYERHGYVKGKFGFASYSMIMKHIPVSPGAGSKYEIKASRDVDWNQLVNYDTSYHVLSREHVLKTFCSIKGSTTKVILERGKIVGYGTIRPVLAGYLIAPLYADNTEACMELLRSLVGVAPSNSPVVLVIPNVSQAGKILLDANKNDVRVLWEGVNMSSKDTPDIPKMNNVLAILSPAICFL